MSSFIVVVIDDLAQTLRNPYIVDIGCIDIDSGIKIGAFLSLVLVLFLFRLFPIFLIRKLTILVLQGMIKLVRGFIFIGRLILRIFESRDWEFGYDSMRKTVTPSTTLIYVSDIKKRLETGFCFDINYFFINSF